MMELLLRAVALYVFLFIFMRAAGHRQFAQMTAFDLVLVIVIAEVTGQAFVGDDFSVTGAVVVIAILVAIDILVSIGKQRWQGLDHVVEGIPTLLVSRGKVLDQNLARERVDKRDILDSARETQGLERFDQIKFAVLETSGKISIIPWSDEEEG